MLWVKAFHIIAVVCWFAMLFYLPRLFVYHASAEDDISKARFKIMERKLYRAIGTPSMIATVALGFWTLSFNPGYYMTSTWFQIKLALVFALVAYHFACGYFIKQFAQDRCSRDHVFFRFFNEAPAIVLVAAVLLVVLKQPI